MPSSSPNLGISLKESLKKCETQLQIEKKVEETQASEQQSKCWL